MDLYNRPVPNTEVVLVMLDDSRSSIYPSYVNEDYGDLVRDFIVMLSTDVVSSVVPTHDVPHCRYCCHSK